MEDPIPDTANNSSAVIIFFMALTIGFAVWLTIIYLDLKVFKRQKNRVDIYMEPLVKAGTLHSLKDYRKAARLKSRYLLFHRTAVAVPLLLVAMVILVVFVFAVPGYDWRRETFFGLVPLTTPVWGLNLWYGLEQDYRYAFVWWQSGITAIGNILALLSGLWLLGQAQGFWARARAIDSKGPDDYHLPLAPAPASEVQVQNNVIGGQRDSTLPH